MEHSRLIPDPLREGEGTNLLHEQASKLLACAGSLNFQSVGFQGISRPTKSEELDMNDVSELFVKY